MAKTQGLGGIRPKLLSIAVASCFVTGTALANPTGPTVVNGTAAIVQNGNLLQITNSPNAILNWQSFSIGANEITRFIQQSQASAVLNRVVGSGGAIDPSVILGALQSNGRVFLINPSGIMFGAGAQVDVAGLVATSLNLSNADFLANRLKFSEVAGAGSVVNQGNITTGSGGQVYLVGSAVTNNGIITSPQGEVVLAAGNSVELVSPGTPNLRVEVTAPDNQAINLGQVVADSGRIGIYAGLIKNAGTLRADSVGVGQDGRIVLMAMKNATLDPTSVLSAQGGGEIKVLADDSVRVAGRLDASAPNGGSGGFIETSGKREVTIDPAAIITTAAPYGRTGMWLIDPNDFTISPSGVGGTTGAAISSALATTNMTITSDSYGGTPGVGNIVVDAAIGDTTTPWNSANSLSLLARNNVFVNQPITNGGTGDISLYAGWNGGSTTTPAVTASTGGINLNAALSTQGNVVLVAGNGVGVQIGTSAGITADQLFAAGGQGGVFLEGPNMVNTLAGTTGTGSFSGFHFNDGKSLTIGTVASANGIVTGNGEIVVNVSGGTLAVNQPVSSTALGGGLGAATSLSATGNLTVASAVSAQTIVGGGGGSGTANVTLNSSGGNVHVTGSGSVLAQSVNSGTTGSYSNSISADGGPTSVFITANVGSVTLDSGSSVIAHSGNGGNVSTSSGVASAIGSSAIVGVHGQAGATVNGSVTAIGGTGGTAISASNGNGIANGGFASIDIDGGNGASVVAGNISATGGNAGTASGIGGIAMGGTAEIIVETESGAVTTTGAITAIAGNGGTVTASQAAAVGMGGEAIVEIGSLSGAVTVNGNVLSKGGNGGNATGTGTMGACGGFNGFLGNACAHGGDAEATIFGISPSVTVNGAVNVNGGTGGVATATGTTHEADGAPAFAAVIGGGTVTIGAGGVVATGGNGGSGGSPRRGGDGVVVVANIQDPNCEGDDCFVFVPAGTLQIGGNLIAQGGNGTGSGTGANGGHSFLAVLAGSVTQTGGTVKAQGGTGSSKGGVALLGMSVGGNISQSGGTISAIAGGTSQSLLGLAAGGNVTIGGGITSTGGPGTPGWFSVFDLPVVFGSGVPSDFTGIGIAGGGTVSINSGTAISGANNFLVSSGGDVALNRNISVTRDIAVVAGQNLSVSGVTLGAPSGLVGLGAGGTTSITGSTISGNLIGLGGGGLSISGSSVNAATDASLSGGAVSIIGSSVVAGNLMSVGANTLTVGPGGALLKGYDVSITAGTSISLVDLATIEAVSSNSIDIVFPLAAGKIFVNGVEQIYDPATPNTGFVVGGQKVTTLPFPGFNVTNLGDDLPPAVDQAVNQVVTSTNQQSTVTEDNKKKTTDESTDTKTAEAEKDKKSLPVCK